ncbi:DUF6258 family protein [Rahnella sikkimica]|uniref:Uncharacterized protein n=1 Tax=Rahnella sikkimica TaxID=1805933 RepID=A0A2L1UR27_9GAMM|nr:DUF6258 family protein [Rahnella sikkimica]AVF35278.1 hypothetical protein BV494_10165 [Rahnella sikkimica]
MIERIYLGDRSVKGIEIDSWNLIVRIKIDFISRLKPGSQNWGFYTDEDIGDGYMVFSGVTSFQVSPPGAIPDDYIVDYSIGEVQGNDLLFKMYSGGMTPDTPDHRGGCYTLIRYQDCWLENGLKERVE